MRELRSVMVEMMSERRDIILSVFFGFLTGITAVSIFGASGYLISKAALLPPFYTLSLMIAFLKLFGFVRAFGRYLERLFSHRATFTILSNLRVSFFERLERLVPSIFQYYRSGDLLSRVVGDIDRLQHVFLRVLYPPIVLVFIFVATIFFTTFYSIYVSLILLAGLVLTGLIIPALISWRQKRVEHSLLEERAELSSSVTEFLYGFRDLKMYQQLSEKEKTLQHFSYAYTQEQAREGHLEKINLSLNTATSLLVSWMVIAVGAYLVTTDQLDGIFLAMLVMISLTVFENATPMALVPGYLEDGRRAAKRLSNVVDVSQKDFDYNQSSLKLPEDQPFGIEVHGAKFAFPEEERNSVDGVSLAIPSGSKTAIVGPSGSGKSTLMQLFLKFFNVDYGEVQLNGESISSYNQMDIWAHTNAVMQENQFFYGTLRDNLLIGNEDATDDEMTSVLQIVNLEHFSLDQKVLEKGENLSGGEKQRLAMARVFLKSANVWLLDEPTSSVDIVTEKSIFDHLFQLAKDDTVLLISHRLIGLERMDQIIVMDKGIIVETGTFDDLMRKRGYLYEMKQMEQSSLLSS